jgi:cupin fold WbuC family metalloprotein
MVGDAAMKIFDALYLDELTTQAKQSPRLRQHRNVHQSYVEASQRLFNAIEPGSYIRPHRHASDPKDELLMAVRGTMALVTFSDDGEVIGVLRLGTEPKGNHQAAGAEVPPGTWHTVIALEPGCVLLEIKAGPFDPNVRKDLAAWAPEEGATDAVLFLQQLISKVIQ